MEYSKPLKLTSEKIEIEVKVRPNTLIEHAEQAVNEFKAAFGLSDEQTKVIDEKATINISRESEHNEIKSKPVNEDIESAAIKYESFRKVEIKILENDIVEKEKPVITSEKDLSALKIQGLPKEDMSDKMYVPAEVVLPEDEENSFNLKGYLVVEKSDKKEPLKSEVTVEKGEFSGLRENSEKVINLTGSSDRSNGETKDFPGREHFGEKKDEAKHEGVNAVQQKNFTKIMDQKIDESQTSKSEIDYSKTIESIVKQVKYQFSRGVNEIKIELEPKFLGKMKMKIRMEDNQLTAKVNVETAEVKRVIETNLDKLRESLQESGVEIEKFDVQVKQENQKELFNENLNGKNNGKGFTKNNINDVKPGIPVEVIKQIRSFGYNSMEITI